MSKETAREYFEKGCNEYLRLFCEKHEFDYELAKSEWVAGDVGTIVCCGDYFVSLGDMMTDIEQDAPKGEFGKWYEYAVDAHTLGITAPNYSSWLNGCPRCSQEEINRLFKLKREFEAAVKEASNIKNS